MSNQLIICTHGEFGKEMIRSAEMIVGKLEGVYSFSLKMGMQPMDFRQQVVDLIEALPEDQFLCLVDLFGGTPCNMVTSINKENLEIVSGLNLAMLIETYSLLQTTSIQALKDIAIQTLLNSGVDVRAKFKEIKSRKG
ncbi:pTS system mannose-specific IIAB component [Firmicutes bacterium CAG:536]|nr:pTS system mannose-specific IIAB component [Firmicutes bacterium CAG:536]